MRVFEHRRAYWSRQWDLGMFGHAFGGTKEEWVQDKLEKEGFRFDEHEHSWWVIKVESYDEQTLRFRCIDCKAETVWPARDPAPPKDLET